jgi:competence/damage-inducible protein CinA-like protein
MKIGILTIGDEITSGRIQDTNTAYLAREFRVRGWEVAAAMSVGDSIGAIRGALDCILSVSDGVVVTGGLGPTADDITTEAITEIYGLRLFTDEAVLQAIKDRFAQRGLRWSDNNAKQAMFPEEAIPLRNPVGTAWGFCLKRVGKPIVVLPGVPMEVKKMVPEVVIPLFEKEDPTGKKAMAVKTIKLFGLGEALIDDALADLKYDHEHVSIGFYPRFPENHLVITSWHDDRSRVDENISSVMKGIQERVGKHIFGYDEDTLEGMIGALLTEKKLTISVAESLTGGLLADRITNVPGSSAYFERGVVTYSNRSKTELLGVPEEVLKEHGAVSKEAAVLMAEGVRRASGTDIGVSTTGIAGPAGGTDAKPVGTIFIAVSDGKRTICRDFSFKWERRRIKEITTQWALELIRRFLTGEDHVR